MFRSFVLAGAAAALLLPVAAASADTPSSLCVPTAADTAVTTPLSNGKCPSGKALKQFAAQSDLTAAEARVTRLEALLSGVSRTTGSRPTIRFSGVNLQLLNGSGASSTLNGLGNLIIGYNESARDQSGSHNLIIGRQNQASSYSSIAAGSDDIASAPYTVAIGHHNRATGSYATVTGGVLGYATGESASVTGGYNSIANGKTSSVTAGLFNTANGDWSSVSGGGGSIAGGYQSSVTGGYHNLAAGDNSSVTGGNCNGAGDPGGYSFPIGQDPESECTTRDNSFQSVTSGTLNLATGSSSAIIAGEDNRITGRNSAILGGNMVSLSGDDETSPATEALQARP